MAEEFIRVLPSHVQPIAQQLTQVNCKSFWNDGQIDRDFVGQRLVKLECQRKYILDVYSQ